MKRRRASSRPSSWRCMWASACARLPELVARGVLKCASKSPLRDALGGPLEAQQAHRQRPRDEHPGEQRDQQARPQPRARIRERTSVTSARTSLKFTL